MVIKRTKPQEYTFVRIHEHEVRAALAMEVFLTSKTASEIVENLVREALVGKYPQPNAQKEQVAHGNSK